MELTNHERGQLERWARAATTPQRTVLRSRIVLLLSEGLSAREIARRLGVSRHTVDLWRTRYLEQGCEGLTRDRPGRGRKRALCPKQRPGSGVDERGVISRRAEDLPQEGAAERITENANCLGHRR